MIFQVRSRQLWGNIVYTQDSDLVAVLMHNGFYNHALQQPPASMAEARRPIQAQLQPYATTLFSERVSVITRGQDQARRAPAEAAGSCVQIRAVVLPLPPQAAYPSSARNSIRSRAWGTAVEGFSYRVRSSSFSFRVRSSSAERSRSLFTRRSLRKHAETGNAE